MNQNNEPKDCLKCPRRGTGNCAFLNRSYNDKCGCLWVRSEGHNAYDADMLTERLLARLNAIKCIEPTYQEMDYSRNDSKQIVNSMRPYNN
jgi:hypothetical protein